MKIFNYFVAYCSEAFGVGNCHITMSDKISSFEDLQKMKSWIEDAFKLKGVIITNFILLSEQEQKQNIQTSTKAELMSKISGMSEDELVVLMDVLELILKKNKE